MKVVIYKNEKTTKAMAGNPADVLKHLGFKYNEAEETAEDFCETYTACYSKRSLTICDLSLSPSIKNFNIEDSMLYQSSQTK